MAIGAQTFSLPYPLSRALEADLEDWEAGDRTRRLWQRDASLWTGADEARWLGWLDVPAEQLAGRGPIEQLARDVLQAGFTHVLLLGMGGSSLCPLVLGETLGAAPSYPRLVVLDSTDPGHVRRVAGGIDPRRTLCVVSSKSGTTLETRLLLEYFLDRIGREVPRSEVGQRFVAITDAGSELEVEAHRNGFRSVFSVRPDVGGRFSALSDFGLVPAALTGLNARLFLERAGEMVHACGPFSNAQSNPGVILGTALATLAARGRDKVTIVPSPPIGEIGLWIEQLLAESTGKEGKGLIPVDREALAVPEAYGRDRVFVHLRLASREDPEQARGVARLEESGCPIIRIEIDDTIHLGQEFFRWEFATAVAGAWLGVNPFDQPDVEASKVATRRHLSHRGEGRAADPEPPTLETPDFRLFEFDDGSGLVRAPGGGSPADCFCRLIESMHAGDYFAILAYMDEIPAHREQLDRIRRMVRDQRRVATTIGFGPRFLHSTGQVHKGGPNTGVFLQITHEETDDLPVPGRTHTFGMVKAAQARGDLEVLVSRKRRVLQAHLRGSNVSDGLDALARAFAHGLRRCEHQSGRTPSESV